MLHLRDTRLGGDERRPGGGRPGDGVQRAVEDVLDAALALDKDGKFLGVRDTEPRIGVQQLLEGLRPRESFQHAAAGCDDGPAGAPDPGRAEEKFESFSFDGKTIDFGTLELTSDGNTSVGS